MPVTQDEQLRSDKRVRQREEAESLERWAGKEGAADGGAECGVLLKTVSTVDIFARTRCFCLKFRF